MASSQVASRIRKAHGARNGDVLVIPVFVKAIPRNFGARQDLARVRSKRSGRITDPRAVDTRAGIERLGRTVQKGLDIVCHIELDKAKKIG